MNEIALAIGIVVMAFGGFLVTVGVIGLLGWLVTFAWMLFSTNFRAICKTESLIVEYRKNRERFLKWNENPENKRFVVEAEDGK